MNYKTKFIPSEKPDVAFVSRPWGTFKQFANNEASAGSLMTMLPGQRMSLQSHVGRAELWIVIDDGATIQVGDRIWEAQAGEEVWIPAEERHRLSNRGNQPIRVLE